MALLASFPDFSLSETGWPVLVLILGVGFVLLAKGATWLVDGGARLALRIGMSALVVGLTVVAWGTSMPEVVVSGLAASQGLVASALGNVLGSNIANIGLVLGASAFLLPAVLQTRVERREQLWMGGSFAALWWFCSDARLTRVEGALLMGLFVGYTLQVWFSSRGEPEVPEASGAKVRNPWLEVVLGSLAITVGAYLVLESGKEGALRMGIDELVVGLAVLAIGTSLPELAAGVKSALRGHSDISVGNVIGSNVFNVLAVLGLAAMIHPFEPPSEPAQAADLEAAFRDALRYDFPAVALFSLAVVLLPAVWKRRHGRVKGIALLLLYVAYWALRPLFTGDGLALGG